MNSVCSDQHKLHQLISPKKHIDLPPRRQHQLYDLSHNLSLGKEGMVADDDDDEELDPYSSDHFRMYEFKVRRCTRSRSHDWTDCPFAHPGEKARRRDPRRYHYSGAVCPEFRRGGCSRGDTCEFAHGVFECWLHPSRYRTEACKDGKNCKRKVCFFAHTPRQLRTPSDPSCNNTRKRGQCCCLVCHSVSSPTSTLLGMSHLSPPMSPEPASRCSERMLRSGSGGVVSYKEVLNELMSSLEAMNFNEAAALCSPLSRASSGRIRANNTHWVDTSFEDDQQQQQQFILSSTPSPSGSGNLFDGNFSRNNSGLGGEFDEKMVNENGNGFGSSDPDLGWVNDLLM